MKLNLFKVKNSGRVISLDLGYSFVKIAYLEYGQGCKAQLLAYDLKKISGWEQDREEIRSFINNFVSKNSIAAKEVVLTIFDSNSIIVKHLELPYVPKDEIKDAIKWQLKDETGFSLEDAIIDYQIIGEFMDSDNAKRVEISSVVANKATIDKLLVLVTECGLLPVRISTSSFNYSSILESCAAKEPVNYILDIGYRYATISVYKNGKLHSSRDLALSSSKLIQALTGTLITDRGKIELTHEQAEAILLEFGIPKDEDAVLKDNIKAFHVISLIRPYLEGLVKELKRSFDYFSSSFKVDFPKTLYITGGGANLKNFGWYLNKELGLSAEKFPFPEMVSFPGKDNAKFESDKSQLISVIGAGLDRTGAINLLPPEIKSQKITALGNVSLRLASLALGGIFLSLFLVVSLEMRDYKVRLKNASTHLVTLGDIENIKRDIDLYEAVINKIEKTKVPVEGILKALSNIVPSNMLLNELIFDGEKYSLNIKGTISAKDTSVEEVIAEFMKGLESSVFFEEASLVNSTKTNLIQTFEISCDLNH